MNSGDHKTYKYVKISKSNFFAITILSLHSICLESKNTTKHFLSQQKKLKLPICIIITRNGRFIRHLVKRVYPDLKNYSAAHMKRVKQMSYLQAPSLGDFLLAQLPDSSCQIGVF